MSQELSVSHICTLTMSNHTTEYPFVFIWTLKLPGLATGVICMITFQVLYASVALRRESKGNKMAPAQRAEILCVQCEPMLTTGETRDDW